MLATDRNLKGHFSPRMEEEEEGQSPPAEPPLAEPEVTEPDTASTDHGLLDPFVHGDEEEE